MTISAWNRLASAVDNATVSGPEMAKASVLKHRGPLILTNWVLPRLEMQSVAGCIFAEARSERKAFVQWHPNPGGGS